MACKGGTTCSRGDAAIASSGPKVSLGGLDGGATKSAVLRVAFDVLPVEICLEMASSAAAALRGMAASIVATRMLASLVLAGSPAAIVLRANPTIF